MRTQLPQREVVLRAIRRELAHLARTIIAVAAAWQVCILLGATDPPIFAALAPIVSLR